MFNGCMSAIITPFRDGVLDREGFARLVEFQVANGVSAIVPCGSTGESATLTHEEHIEIIRLAVEVCAGRVPVIAGTGSNSTREAIALTQAAENAGASAALLISPYYNKPTQEGIYRHYRAIGEQVRIPLIVYNIPGRTASKIEPVTIARLAELEAIVGLKEATGSLDEAQEVLRLCGDRLELYAGDDALTLPLIAVGGVGVISVLANIVPRQVSDLVHACLQNDWSLARRLHYGLLPLMRALFQEVNPIGIKAALAMTGHCRDELRLPLLPMTAGPRERLQAALRDLDLL
jgi:4-hydroxy-tetrahydrodipicolinate synthase